MLKDDLMVLRLASPKGTSLLSSCWHGEAEEKPTKPGNYQLPRQGRKPKKKAVCNRAQPAQFELRQRLPKISI